MNDFEIIEKLKAFLKDVYPNIIIKLEKDESVENRKSLIFFEEKFRDLFPLQRFHYIVHKIPDEFLQENLKNTKWYELAPDEKIEDYKFPDEDYYDKISEHVLRYVDNTDFYNQLDNLMCPESSDVEPIKCDNNFTLSKQILNQMKINIQDQTDIFNVFMINGGYCDCEILYNVAEQSRLKHKYWTNRQGQAPPNIE